MKLTVVMLIFMLAVPTDVLAQGALDTNHELRIASQAGSTVTPARLVLNLGFGATKDAIDRGWALTAGAAIEAGPIVATVTAADLILSSGDSYPYYRDTFDNGSSVCRNSLNGEFADDSKCLAVDVAYALTADLALRVPSSPMFVGGGKRFDKHSSPWYGTIGATWFRRNERIAFGVRVNLGKSYVSGVGTIGFRLGGG